MQRVPWLGSLLYLCEFLERRRGLTPTVATKLSRTQHLSKSVPSIYKPYHLPSTVSHLALLLAGVVKITARVQTNF